MQLTAPWCRVLVAPGGYNHLQLGAGYLLHLVATIINANINAINNNSTIIANNNDITIIYNNVNAININSTNISNNIGVTININVISNNYVTKIINNNGVINNNKNSNNTGVINFNININNINVTILGVNTWCTIWCTYT